MTHAESPSLIALGLATDTSRESSSFRWGLATSCAIHVLIIILAISLRFQAATEEPFRAIDVTLISLPEAQPPAARQEKVSPHTPVPPKTEPPAQKAQPARSTPPPPQAQPMEEQLPPLPTQTASERLSEFLGSAIGSISVLKKQEMTAAEVPLQDAAPIRPLDQSPLIGDLHLPSTAPQLSRPERMHPARALTIPKEDPPPPRHTRPSDKIPPQSQEPERPSPPQPAKAEPVRKQAPAVPELNPVVPFHKTEKETTSSENPSATSMAESLKHALPTIPTQNAKPKLQRKTTSGPLHSKRSSVPEMSAPQMAKIQPPLAPGKPPSPRKKTPPQRVQTSPPPVAQAPLPAEQVSQSREMSQMMKQLLGEVKVPSLKPQPPTPLTPPQKSTLSSSSTQTNQSEMDQRIAKLSIPNVTPVESIKNRLQLLEGEFTSGSGKSSSQASPHNYKYQEIVQGILQNQWENTPLVADAPIVVLKFRISRSGEITQIRISESSGNAHYDSAAQRAVRAVNPLPPFPPEISDSYLDVRWIAIKEKKN